MLRRVFKPVSSFAAVARRFQTNGGNDDKAELDREQQLRQRFESLKKASSGSGFGGFTNALRQQMELAQRARAQQQQQSGTGPSTQPLNFGIGMQMFYTAILYTTAIYALLLVWQSGDDQSMVSTMQGSPWWAAPSGTTAAALLSRVCHSLSTQREIRTALEENVKYNRTEGFDAYALRARPELFAGYRYTAFEVLDTTARAIQVGGMGCTKVITDTARTAGRDPKQQFDAIVDALRRSYPNMAIS